MPRNSLPRIYEAIRAPYECPGHLVTADASIGIAFSPEDGTDLDQLAEERRIWQCTGPKPRDAGPIASSSRAWIARVKALRALELDLRQAIAMRFRDSLSAAAQPSRQQVTVAKPCCAGATPKLA